MYERILRKYEPTADNLLFILHEIQDNEPKQYIPEQGIREVSDYLDLSPSQVYSVITFYSLYSVSPRGKYIVRVCDSPPCHLMGSVSIIDELSEILGIKEGETTENGMFSLEVVSCLGVCGVAPAMMINKELFGNLTPEKVRNIIDKYRQDKQPASQVAE